MDEYDGGPGDFDATKPASPVVMQAVDSLPAGTESTSEVTVALK